MCSSIFLTLRCHLRNVSQFYVLACNVCLLRNTNFSSIQQGIISRLVNKLHLTAGYWVLLFRFTTCSTKRIFFFAYYQNNVVSFCCLTFPHFCLFPAITAEKGFQPTWLPMVQNWEICLIFRILEGELWTNLCLKIIYVEIIT